MTETQTTPPNQATNKEPIRAVQLPPIDEKKNKPPKPGLFSKESKVGRFLQKALRILALIVGFYALGVLTIYIMLYMPTHKDLLNTRAVLVQTQTTLQQKQAVVDQQEKDISDLAKLRARVSALQAVNQVSATRQSLALKDTPSAKLALDQAEQILTTAAPQFAKLNVGNDSSFKTLFDLARKDLERDPHLADQDLQRLTSEILLIDSALSK